MFVIDEEVGGRRIAAVSQIFDRELGARIRGGPHDCARTADEFVGGSEFAPVAGWAILDTSDLICTPSSDYGWSDIL